MDAEALRSSPSGETVKVGEGAWAFVPNPLPPAIDYQTDLVELIAQAEADLGALRGIGQRLPNPHLLIVPYMRREAVLSSRIEGTQSTLSDLFLFEIQESKESRDDDVREVVNYVKAMTQGLQLLDTLPLSLRLVRKLHATLMEGVRGANKTPGEFRRIQNWIGQDRVIGHATYIPPPVPQMRECLEAWERFLHVRSGWPVLIQCALMHYQFEVIHPFIDGNGRVGRLLITLFLCERGRLRQPLLYLSAFFEEHRRGYYEGLLGVSRDGAWSEWLMYFLRGVSLQSRVAVQHAGKILDLHTTYRKRLQQDKATGSTLTALDRLFENPFVTSKTIAKATGKSMPTAHDIINRLVAANILTEITGKKSWRVYCAEELLRTLEEPPEPQEP